MSSCMQQVKLSLWNCLRTGFVPEEIRRFPGNQLPSSLGAQAFQGSSAARVVGKFINSVRQALQFRDR